MAADPRSLYDTLEQIVAIKEIGADASGANDSAGERDAMYALAKAALAATPSRPPADLLSTLRLIDTVHTACDGNYEYASTRTLELLRPFAALIHGIPEETAGGTPTGVAVAGQICPSCASQNVTEASDTSHIPYGADGPDQVIITYTQPFMRCADCKESWTDWRGEEAQTAAIERYRRMFSPAKSASQQAQRKYPMDIGQRLQAELNRPDGSTGSGQEIHALITDALAEIQRLSEWERMHAAFVTHGQPFAKDPLWPNPKWSQDVAMIAHALAKALDNPST